MLELQTRLSQLQHQDLWIVVVNMADYVFRCIVHNYSIKYNVYRDMEIRRSHIISKLCYILTVLLKQILKTKLLLGFLAETPWDCQTSVQLAVVP